MQFQHYVPNRIEFGAGKLETIGTHTKTYGSKAMIVTTGPFFQETGLIGRIQGYLKDADVSNVVYLDASPNPHAHEADKGAQFAIENKVDVVIGVGGGSAIDAAKCIAVGAAQGEPIWPYWIGEKEIYKALPIIAVTTTSGTGSHITPYSVITNSETNEKPGAGSDLMFAKVAIVDPELTETLPRKMTAATGFDVLAHAIEAYTSGDATPFSDMYSEEAIRLTAKYLIRAIENGADKEAREGMALADTLSGCAISIAVITMCHAIGHAVGGVCNTVHGETLAAMTPSSMRHSIGGRPEKYRRIGSLLNGMEVAPDSWTTEDSVKAVEKFIKDIGLDIPLSEQGVKKSDFDEIIEGAMSYMAGSMALDPVPVTKEDVRKVLEESF